MFGARRLLERLARGRILHRHLPAAFGGRSVFVTPDARLSYLFHRLETTEKLLLDWAESFVRSGQSVWDVGANCGVFSVAAAVQTGTGGKVLAVEPDPFLGSLIRRSAAALAPEDGQIDVLPAAVAEEAGRGELHLAARGRAANWLDGSPASTQTGGVRGSVEVEVVTLDGLLSRYRPPGLVKIDVEGSEDRVLRGASRLLAEIRPVLLVEVSAPHREAVGRRLRVAGYRLFDAERDPGCEAALGTPAENTLALPF